MSFNPILLYHPESDCYFIGDYRALANGMCEDVTGCLDHMKEAQKRGVEMPNGKTTAGLEYSQTKIEFQNKVIISGTWQTCINCEHWCNGKSETTKHFGAPDGWQGCTIHKAMPPPEVIVNGCKDHIDQIPF